MVKYLATLCLLICSLPPGSIQAQEDKSLTESAIFSVRVEKDVAYLPADRAEKADLYLPDTAVDQSLASKFKTFPGIVIIHGGGWTGGDKDAAREQNIGTYLASRGYVCMSINYMLQPKDGPRIWPKNLHDCKTAVRWLRANHEKFKLDTDHIGVIGGSAGGHLSLMVGLTDASSGLDPDGPYADQPCKVQAVVDLYGPIADTPKWTETLVGPDASQFPKLAKQVTPLSHLDRNDPPVLIIHGTADKTVDLRDSEVMDKALEAAGVEHRLIVVQGAPHSFHLQPKEQDLRLEVERFFNKHLR